MLSEVSDDQPTKCLKRELSDEENTELDMKYYIKEDDSRL